MMNRRAFGVLVISMLIFGLSIAPTLANALPGPTEREDLDWQVTEIYLATLGYVPDAEGLDYWVNAIESQPEWTITSVAMSFFDQPLVQDRYPSTLSESSLIDALYQNLFGIEPDAEGKSYWLAELESGRMQRSQMIIALINGGWANPDSTVVLNTLGNKVKVGLSFASFQRDYDILYRGLSASDQALLHEVGAEIIENITSDDNSVDQAIAEIGDRLSPLLNSTSFQRIATLGNYLNLDSANLGEVTVSEIVATTQNGETLVYTDSPGEAIGFVDLSNPAKPEHLGRVALEGEPTSVDVIDNLLALVAVNASADFVMTGGQLVVVNIPQQTIVGRIELGGQPDSIKISSKGDYAAVVIENERDEEITVDEVEGGLPQAPAGYLVIIDIQGTDPTGWGLRRVELTGLASYGSSDPEPEFVDINSKDQAVVTLQENNHLVVVDLPTGEIVEDFDLGTVDLTQVDATEDGIISLTDSLDAVFREPDAVAWVSLDNLNTRYLIATANEGDLFGGSRGFSLFDPESTLDPLVYDSGSSFEEIAVRYGHYPEDRSENKGSEPESIEFGRFGEDDYLFVGSERGSFVAVYKMEDGQPVFSQLLPAPLGPEGLLAIPSRDLLIASGEEDDPEYGVRSSIMIYRLGRGNPAYPQILSGDDTNGSPIPWSALSGMVGDPNDPARVYAVWDSYYSESRIFTIDVSASPAVITDALTISGGTGNYDPEGIAIAPDGTFWIASEGNADDSRPNRLLQVSADTGVVLQEIGLPDEILACRAASESTSTLGSGFEGLAVQTLESGYRLLVAQQRGWNYSTAECEELDDDAGGLDANGQPRHSRLWFYDPSNGDWDHIAWELKEVPEHASWIGLSEISLLPNDSFVLIERDNRTGDFAVTKTLVEVDVAAMDDGLISESEKSTYDILPKLKATNGWVTDKPEGVAVTNSGVVYLVTDNDGVDGWSGETWFLNMGHYQSLFD